MPHSHITMRVESFFGCLHVHINVSLSQVCICLGLFTCHTVTSLLEVESFSGCLHAPVTISLSQVLISLVLFTSRIISLLQQGYKTSITLFTCPIVFLGLFTCPIIISLLYVLNISQVVYMPHNDITVAD